MTDNWKEIARITHEAAIRKAIRDAQQGVPGHTHRGFCDQVTAAGCAGYVVSLPGRRVLYFGRSGETHTEYFPGTAPATH